MGYDARVFIVYGIPFTYGPDSEKDLKWLLELMVPDLVKEWGDDVWCCFDNLPHTNDYFLLEFRNDAKLFVSCWWMERDGPQLIDMPTDHKKEKFLNWCANHNIDTSQAGFYSIIGD